MNPVSSHPFGSGGLCARMYQLDNGLRVLLLRDPAAPIVAYQTWFRVGSRHEREGKTGIAHLFEHLMFNETSHLKPGEFDRLLEERGGHSNAATWVDWTYYQDDLPAEDLHLAVRLEADRMEHLVIRDHQIESEREVVMNERRFRVEDDVDGFMSEEIFRLAFEHHPYHWPTIGWMRDIKGISVDDALAFYRTYYAPNNATLVLVGDFEETAALDLIARHYAHLPPQPIPQEVRVIEPAQTGERRALYKKPVANDKLLLAYKAPSMLDPEHLQLQVLSDILMGGASSRVYRDLVVEREVASSLGASVMPFRDPGLWEISVSVQRGHSALEAETLIDEHIERIKEEGPTEAELERSKARFLTHFYAEMRSAHGKAEALGHYETTCGDYQRLFAIPQALRAITVADVHHVARHYLRGEARTVVMATPQGREEAREGAEEAQEAPPLSAPVHHTSDDEERS